MIRKRKKRERERKRKREGETDEEKEKSIMLEIHKQNLLEKEKLLQRTYAQNHANKLTNHKENHGKERQQYEA